MEDSDIKFLATGGIVGHIIYKFLQFLNRTDFRGKATSREELEEAILWSSYLQKLRDELTTLAQDLDIEKLLTGAVNKFIGEYQYAPKSDSSFFFYSRAQQPLKLAEPDAVASGTRLEDIPGLDEAGLDDLLGEDE